MKRGMTFSAKRVRLFMVFSKVRPGNVEEEGHVVAIDGFSKALDVFGYGVGGADADEAVLPLEVEPGEIKVAGVKLVFGGHS